MQRRVLHDIEIGHCVVQRSELFLHRHYGRVSNHHIIIEFVSFSINLNSGSIYKWIYISDRTDKICMLDSKHYYTYMCISHTFINARDAMLTTISSSS